MNREAVRTERALEFRQIVGTTPRAAPDGHTLAAEGRDAGLRPGCANARA